MKISQNHQDPSSRTVILPSKHAKGASGEPSNVNAHSTEKEDSESGTATIVASELLKRVSEDARSARNTTSCHRATSELDLIPSLSFQQMNPRFSFTP